MNATDVLRTSIGYWNDADRQAFIACHTDDCEVSSPSATGRGHDGVAAFWTTTMGSVPDGRVTEVRLICEGDTVVEEARVRGTNTGPSYAPDGSEIPATGQTVDFRFAAVHTVRDGKIAASRFYWDGLDVIRQLGLLPDPA